MSKVLIVYIVLFFSAVFSFNILLRGEYFVRLSESFLSGKTYFLKQPGADWLDTTPYQGKYYSPHGPLPSIVLTPFVYVFKALGVTFYQGYLQPFLVLGIFVLIYKIAKTVGYKKEDSLFFAFAFCFSSVFLGNAFWPHFISHTLTTFFLFLLIYGYLKNFRPLWSGVLIGLSFLTRASTIGVVVFPILNIIFGGRDKRTVKYSKLIMLTTPVIVSLIFYFLYNWVRFQNIFESGYSSAINLEVSLRSRDYGVMNLIHIPGNIYYFLLATPLPVFRDEISQVLAFPFLKGNPWGMSLFVTSPIFFYLFFLTYKDKLSKIILITAFLISVPIFLFYGIGVRQFGYRYSLDFLPFLFWLLIKNYKLGRDSLSTGLKIVILVSAMINVHFFITTFLWA